MLTFLMIVGGLTLAYVTLRALYVLLMLIALICLFRRG